MNKLKDIDYKILFGLMKNSKISDRKLGKILGVSQPTITRRRASLEKKLSLRYTAIPDWEELGIQIIAFIFASWKPETRKPLRENSRQVDKIHDAFLAKHPNLVFSASGRGLGMGSGGLFMSFHTDYASYVSFMKELEVEWGEYMDKLDSFIVSVTGKEIRRPLTFKYLGEYIKESAR